jgi:hypothetical protein
LAIFFKKIGLTRQLEVFYLLAFDAISDE